MCVFDLTPRADGIPRSSIDILTEISRLGANTSARLNAMPSARCAELAAALTAFHRSAQAAAMLAERIRHEEAGRINE